MRWPLRTRLQRGAAMPEAGLADAGRRFRWLDHPPRSAVIQPGPVHTGVTEDPEAELDWIAEGMLD